MISKLKWFWYQAITILSIVWAQKSLQATDDSLWFYVPFLVLMFVYSYNEDTKIRLSAKQAIKNLLEYALTTDTCSITKDGKE